MNNHSVKCDWCGNSFPSSREHRIEECSGQIEWNEWREMDEEEYERLNWEEKQSFHWGQ